MKRSPPRVLYASLLLATALAALLIAWFVSGWADVRAQQRELRAEPERAAERRGAELAHELRGELAKLMTRELERPYFHYSNLFHDPRAGNNWSVAPSPLSSGPEDPLVLGHFQLDPAGRVTTPTINDEVPELSEPKHLADNRRFRDEVTRNLVAPLREARKGPDLVADAKPQVSRPRGQGDAQGARAQVQEQVIQIDPSSYAQNAMSNEVYAQQQRVVPAQAAIPANRASSIPIMISPFEWRTYPFAGAPTLIAVRDVRTPDGTLVQGFVVDRSAMTTWLASQAGEAVAELRAGDDGTAAEVAPGWHLAVTANPRTLVQAAADASSIARGFVLRFIVVGVIAALAFGFVVLLVARAEQLARERSQFAAAAAHELRTPLAGLQLYGDMLADGLGDPAKVRDYARRMSEEASRLGRVVSNVLGFSQLERGNLHLSVEARELGTALCELAERAEPALDRSGAALALDVQPDLRARFDRDALARIVGNLLDNAEKYGREAEDRTICLSARALDGGVEITVTDRGPGISPQARPRLFRAFERGVTTDGPAGLGLGLALSRSLARAMGGELEYRPAAGGGAAFVVRLLPA
ncbi:MAG: histidine kinase [Deltaproteobacteria bacterium]|nr:histidine kinase [Deltaproteobacteria bacterium]